MWWCPTAEEIEAIAASGNVEVAEQVAAAYSIPLPEPLSFDCSLEEFRERVLPEVERRLS